MSWHHATHFSPPTPKAKPTAKPKKKQEPAPTPKKFTKITIDEVEKAMETQMDKYSVEAMQQMIRDNCIPEVLFVSETWKKEHNVTKLDILEIIQSNASKEFITKHNLNGQIKVLANKLNIEKLNTLYMEFYKTYYNKMYMTTKENTIKQEETWAQQQQIYVQMLEDRKEHVKKCKAEFYENARQIQEKMDQLKQIPCTLQHAFPGKYGYQFCSTTWRTFYTTALGPNYSDIANEERKKVIELFYSEHPKVKEGYMYKVDVALPHNIYQGKLPSANSYATHKSGKWVYMADYDEKDTYGKIKDVAKYKSMIYDSEYYLRTYEDFVYYYRQKENLPKNLISHSHLGGYGPEAEGFNIIFGAMYQTKLTKEQTIKHVGWNRYPTISYVNVETDTKKKRRQNFFQEIRSELKKEYNFITQIRKDVCSKVEYNKWITTKGGSSERKKGTAPPIQCGVFKCGCIYHQRFNIKKYNFKMGHLYSDYYYSI